MNTLHTLRLSAIALSLLCAAQAHAAGTVAPKGTKEPQALKTTMAPKAIKEPKGPKAAELLSLCATCHGVDGVSSADLYPNLAGQKQAYLAKQLRDFRAGERANEIMAPMAGPLDDEAIEQLTDYFSSLPASR